MQIYVGTALQIRGVIGILTAIVATARRVSRPNKETILKRIREDGAYAQALYNEAIDAILSGEREEGLLMMRDIVNGLREMLDFSPHRAVACL